MYSTAVQTIALECGQFLHYEHDENTTDQIKDVRSTRLIYFS
jgi:hypothetical protein